MLIRFSAYRALVIAVLPLLSLNFAWAKSAHRGERMAAQTASALSVSPTNPHLAIGTTLQFAASSTATWTANCGTITANSGLYKAPWWTGTCTITAKDSSGTTASTVAAIGLPIEGWPLTRVHALQQLQFTAGVAVTWSASCGSITSGGLFAAPAIATTCTITATAAGGVRRGQSKASVSIANYTSWKNSPGGVGSETDELQLNPANVSSGRFFQSWSAAVDGIIWGQPLYLNALTVSGKARNVVFVATANDSVYAFDADTGAQLWKRSFLSTGVSAISGACLPLNPDNGNFNPQTGVLGTPVVNAATHTIYVVAETLENQTSSTFPCGTYVHRLHALDVVTGQDKLSGPVVISDPGLQPVRKWQRPALLLANNTIYIGFGSINDISPYHGLLFAYNASTLAKQPVFNTTPTGDGGGLWMSAAAPTADSSGNIYVPVGNGDFDGTSNFGESVLKLSPTLQRLDFFTPFNWQALNAVDDEIGSSNVLVVPTQTGPFPHELIVCGKPSPIYVLNRDALGGVGTTSDHVIQRLDHQLGGTGNIRDSGLPCFTTPSMWKQNVYFVANHDVMKMFTLDASTGMLSSTPAKKGSFIYNWPGANPVISANGTSNGVVWTVDLSTNTLRANDANDVSKVLFVSPNFGKAIRWMVPTVINGHVYIGLQNKIVGYSMH